MHEPGDIVHYVGGPKPIYAVVLNRGFVLSEWHRASHSIKTTEPATTDQITHCLYRPSRKTFRDLLPNQVENVLDGFLLLVQIEFAYDSVNVKIKRNWSFAKINRKIRKYYDK